MDTNTIFRTTKSLSQSFESPSFRLGKAASCAKAAGGAAQVGASKKRQPERCDEANGQYNLLGLSESTRAQWMFQNSVNCKTDPNNLSLSLYKVPQGPNYHANPWIET